MKGEIVTLSPGRPPTKPNQAMKKNSKTKHYYALEYARGIATSANTGKRYGVTYHVFPAKDKRDQWIQGGRDFRSSPGWREAVKSNDPELRAELRLEADPERHQEAEIVRH